MRTQAKGKILILTLTYDLDDIRFMVDQVPQIKILQVSDSHLWFMGYFCISLMLNTEAAHGLLLYFSHVKYRSSNNSHTQY